MPDDPNKLKPAGKVLPLVSAKLVKKDPSRAAEILDSLPLRERVEIILGLGGKARLDLIMLSENPLALVRLMPEEEVYLTVKELGEEGALPLISLTNIRQLNYILDLEWWHKDRVDLLMVLRWFGLLLDSGPAKVMQWIQHADEELVVLVFFKLIRVFTPDPDDEGQEPWRTLPLFSLDSTYYVYFPDQNLAPLLEQVLSVIRDQSQDLYYSLLDIIGSAIPAELEDESYKFRQARLADKGFVPFDEALEIYDFLPPQKMKALENNPPSLQRAQVRGPAPRFGLDLPMSGAFLSQVIEGIVEPEVIEDVRFGVAWLLNRILVADSVDLDRPKAMQNALGKVMGYLDIGLWAWSQGDSERARSLLRTQWLGHVFQAGYSEILLLTRGVRGLMNEGWLRQVDEPFELLGEPIGPVLQGLLQARPQYHSGRIDENGSLLGEFKSWEEVRQARRCVDRAEFLGDFFFKGLGLEVDNLTELAGNNLIQLNFEAVFLTAFVKGLVSGRFVFSALEAHELVPALENLLTDERKGKIRTELRDGLLEWIERRVEQSGIAQKEQAVEWVNYALDLLQEELGLIDIKAIDPRLVSTLVVVSGE